jgi:hypothetical protein
VHYPVWSIPYGQLCPYGIPYAYPSALANKGILVIGRVEAGNRWVIWPVAWKECAVANVAASHQDGAIRRQHGCVVVRARNPAFSFGGHTPRRHLDGRPFELVHLAMHQVQLNPCVQTLEQTSFCTLAGVSLIMQRLAQTHTQVLTSWRSAQCNVIQPSCPAGTARTTAQAGRWAARCW